MRARRTRRLKATTCSTFFPPPRALASTAGHRCEKFASRRERLFGTPTWGLVQSTKIPKGVRIWDATPGATTTLGGGPAENLSLAGTPYELAISHFSERGGQKREGKRCRDARL